MSTQSQIAPNQVNAHTPPAKAEEGIGISSRNNSRHDRAGNWMLLPDEDPSEFKKLFESLRNEHQPSTPTETLLVEQKLTAEKAESRSWVRIATAQYEGKSPHPVILTNSPKPV
jgi:hypothetical protein